MFFVKGIRRLELSGHILPGTCPICETKSSVQLLVLQPYVHFFWIPLFPTPRRARTRCMVCGHEQLHKKLPVGTIQLFHDLKKQSRTPLWTWSGAALLAVIVPLFVQSMGEHFDEQASLLATPAVGDVWTMKLGPKWYTLYRVEEVRADSVFVRTSGREAHGGIVMLAAMQADSTVTYAGERRGYARGELQALDKQGGLYSVDR
ncbi:MAG: hypothetical protein IT229_00680 [Flavobacteriales bacterium]|nr:hypothetical protein [Flavobacteriales bacterium]